VRSNGKHGGAFAEGFDLGKELRQERDDELKSKIFRVWYIGQPE
jgi:hypothetical protein